MPVILVKPIYAKPIDKDGVRLELLNALRKEGTATKREMEKTVTTWTNPPNFETSNISLEGGNARVEVSPSGDAEAVQHWIWVDEGTRAHIIRPRGPWRLRFQSGYRAKTKIRQIASYVGGATGPVVYAKQVKHPGTRARKFRSEIARKRKHDFERAMRDAAERGANKTYRG